MTTFFGMIDFSGRPLEPGSIEAMREATRANPGDVEQVWYENNVALGCNLRWITPESKTEVLPLVRPAPGGQRVITACARIDNRKELGDKLGISANESKDQGDSEFILRAYEKWGENCVDHLLGDFAFAIWDQPTGKLFCARDHMGIQPLFYRRLENQLVIANNIEPLILGCFPTPVLKLDTVARYLRDGENYSVADTFFEDVFQLPPGSCMVSKETGVKITQYWSLEQVQPLELDTSDDCYEMLLERFSDAVRCRHRSNYPIGAHLSGGLDSSAIVACAGSMDSVDSTNLSTFNWMYPPESEEELSAPEWALGREIAETYKLPHHYTEYASNNVLDILRSHDIAMGDTVDVWAEKAVARKAADMGIRTMLSGWGGDQLITHYGNDVYAERVIRGQVIASFWELLKTARARNKGMYSYPKYVNRCIVQPLLRAYMPPFTSRYRELNLKFLDYALPGLCAIASQQEKLRFYEGISLRDQQLCPARLAHLQNRVSSWAVSGRQLGLSYSYPLLDKRLVEMAVAVPFELYRKNDIPRYLFKRTVKELKPVGFWGRDQKYEPYRVARSLSLSVDALRAWAQKRRSGECAGQLIDEPRLIDDISDLERHKLGGKYGMARKVMAINRSILVLGLDRYL